MNETHHDVLVLGGGLAGLSTAIMLKQQWGAAVLVVDRSDKKERVGDTLSPSCKKVLRQLGVWESFIADDHHPCYGHRSCWEGNELHYMDYMNHPEGNGWNVNRTLFEQRLRERAMQVGIQILQDIPIEIEKNNTTSGHFWSFSTGESSGTVKFVIDATGRRSIFSKKMGVRRLKEDRQMAVFAYYEAKQRSKQADSFSLVESVENGWLYSARLPQEKHLVICMTDPEVVDVAELQEPDRFHELLRQTKHTYSRILQSKGVMLELPRCVTCASGRMEHFYGENWLAVGDAALTLDPISAHGMTQALVSGRDAAETVYSYLNEGREFYLQQYSKRLFSTYEYYTTRRAQFYHSVQKWPHSAYWLRRREIK